MDEGKQAYPRDRDRLGSLRVGQRNGQKRLIRGCFKHFFACGFYCLYGSQGVREGSRGQFWVNLGEIKILRLALKKGVF